jgi:hypothetical protein
MSPLQVSPREHATPHQKALIPGPSSPVNLTGGPSYACRGGTLEAIQTDGRQGWQLAVGEDRWEGPGGMDGLGVPAAPPEGMSMEIKQAVESLRNTYHNLTERDRR